MGAHFAALSLTKWPPSRAALKCIFHDRKTASLSKVIGKPASPLQLAEQGGSDRANIAPCGGERRPSHRGWQVNVTSENNQAELIGI
jgi:hypothetical protein